MIFLMYIHVFIHTGVVDSESVEGSVMYYALGLHQ